MPWTLDAQLPIKVLQLTTSKGGALVDTGVLHGVDSGPVSLDLEDGDALLVDLDPETSVVGDVRDGTGKVKALFVCFLRFSSPETREHLREVCVECVA
eukprot:CAMPEP_0184342482 /NCGR_PEP_ID=MMETSP1089-20130417/11086_1 /TAXON_ID=38269 ORGANISM="Gloeochaete wittrockiana, Strain SAG46.84" /NCGR_SAMPLE_ID=MMETSP1089 /ASSEMBLY_ACC=CAM_ASM_000445 /LENGTH=97 /DNA_ID=CAMNT_0026671369 /DNA_START=186 /DNA_END=479 /DNA_ORIENTATION=+